MPKRRRSHTPPIEATVQPVGRVNQRFDGLKRILLIRCLFLLLWEEKLRQQRITTQSIEPPTETVMPSTDGGDSPETEVSTDSGIIIIESDEESDKLNGRSRCLQKTVSRKACP